MTSLHTNLFKSLPFTKAGLISSLVVFIHRSISAYYRYQDNPTMQTAKFEGERVFITTGASLAGNVFQQSLISPLLKRFKPKGELIPTLAFGLVTTAFVIAGEQLSRTLVKPLSCKQADHEEAAPTMPNRQIARLDLTDMAPKLDQADLFTPLQQQQQPVFPQCSNLNISERVPTAPFYYSPIFMGQAAYPAQTFFSGRFY